MCYVSAAQVPTGDDTAAIIDIKSAFTTQSVQAVKRQIDRARDQGAGTIIFRFSGRGSSFESFSDLARQIARLTDKHNVRTVAYIPNEALGMTAMPVFACREIVADEFAQIGQVIPPAHLQRQLGKQKILPLTDEQLAVNKITSFAQAAGHEPLLARAMTQKRLILYEIGRDGQKKLVDQGGFERLVQQTQPPWSIVGAGPIVGGDEALLLSGRRAFELGLAAQLAGDQDELLDVLKVELIDIIPAAKTTTPVPADANAVAETEEPDTPEKPALDKTPFAVVIICDEMIDEGLYQAIKRRTESALQDGATHIIYQIDTFGGRLDSAISIWDYFMHDVAKRAHTVAYVPTKAISAGALISVACNDIIMKSSTRIGDCAPIAMGATLEGIEREKVESPTRSYFESAATANGYPVALCKAMVTMGLEVYQVQNLQTDRPEYFEADQLPQDPYLYDLEGKVLIDKKDELLTVTAEKALEYGLNRAVVDSLDGALSFLEKRDKVTFARPVTVLKTNWSEELVRWLASPSVTGILFMVALLGIYAELNSPGLGLPGAVALIALAILFGSKFFIGMANWWEIALFVLGFGLLLLEVFVIPGFGVAGISGFLLMIFALGAMMVQNQPGEWPIPTTEPDWEGFKDSILWLMYGFGGFLIGAYFFSRYLPKIPFANRLVLAAPTAAVAVPTGGLDQLIAPAVLVEVGQKGVTLSQLRPAGKAQIASHRVDVVSRGALIEADRKIIVVAVEGNRIVVKETEDQESPDINRTG